MDVRLSSKIGVAGIVLVLCVGMVFPAMAESFPLKLVTNSDAPVGKLYVSVDFDDNGICDENAVLISVSMVQKIGINEQCILPTI